MKDKEIEKLKQFDRIEYAGVNNENLNFLYAGTILSFLIFIMYAIGNIILDDITFLIIGIIFCVLTFIIFAVYTGYKKNQINKKYRARLK